MHFQVVVRARQNLDHHDTGGKSLQLSLLSNDRKRGKSHMRFVLLLVLLVSQAAIAQKFDLVSSASSVSIVYDSDAKKLDSITAHLLANDIEAITDVRPAVTDNLQKVTGNAILIGAVNSRLIQSLNDPYFNRLTGKWECYSHKLVKQPFKNISMALVIAGSDPRGTAYGVFSLSEKIGISPWYWWADVHPEKKKQLSLNITPFTSLPPAVKFRGIFINDEDWGLQPWAAKTFEPETGDIGPKTYAKVFELLLRLKANLIWPAMHESTKAFFHYPNNPIVAEDYQIVIGSSHAEPMLRNNISEWNVATMGRFNYLTNKANVLKYWEDRVKESKGLSAMYSLGIRGVHDSQMEGIKDLKEAVPIMEQVIKEERNLLTKHINKNITAVPQVLTLYKEVLDIYDNGLKVPEDVTLVWPDDNYGYIARLNNNEEKARKSGAGVYYHASYWGRPHDYLWLPSTHPALVREEMMKAYETGANSLWVLNVGDIKPQEYNIQQFLDMAYNADRFKDSRYTRQHLQQWATELFGKEKGPNVSSVLWEYYRLAFERKPEFMGWSQTEPTTQTKYTQFNHFNFGDEAQRRIDQYDKLEKEVKEMRLKMPSKDADAFYQLVYYPVVGASMMNKKFLYRDKSYIYSKQNRLSAFDYALWSQAAYDSIVKETEYFNTQVAGGKWKDVMSMKPRNLPVYQPPVLPAIKKDSTNAWGISPEGYDSTLISNTDSLSLLPFDNLNRQQYFVDVFLSRNQQVQWTASVSADWIRLSKTTGVLTSENGMKQQRIWVDVDWSKIKETSRGMITFTAGDKKIQIRVEAKDIKTFPSMPTKSFVENNGFLSINASHFSRQINKSPYHWTLVDGPGYTESALQALPLTLHGKPVVQADSIRRFNSYVEYDFYTTTAGQPVVTVFALPTHALNNNFRVRYGISIDNDSVKTADIKTFGRSEEWKQNVLRNRAERKIKMSLLQPGKHTLRIYCVDPGVVLDEIRIDLGGLKNAYGLISETRSAL